MTIFGTYRCCNCNALYRIEPFNRSIPAFCPYCGFKVIGIVKNEKEPSNHTTEVSTTARRIG